MSETKETLPTYRTVSLPGLGCVQVPNHISDAQVLAEVLGNDPEATPDKKTNKKP